MTICCPVCDGSLQKVPPALPGEIGVCRFCRSPLYFGPAGWRVLEDHEIAVLGRGKRVCLEILMTAKVDA